MAGRGLPRLAIVAAVAWLVVYALGIAFVHAPGARVAQSDVVYAMPDLVGALACAWVLWGHSKELIGRGASSVRWLGVSCGLSFAADMLYASYYYIDGRSEVFPSWADPLWLASDAALVAAIACAFARVSITRRLRGGLDALVAGLGLAAALWVTGVGDTDGQGFVSSLVTVAYPVADLVMLVLLLSVGVGSLRRLPLPLMLLGTGCLFLVGTDLLSAYLTTFDTYAIGSWLDLGWQTSAIFTVLAVVSIAGKLDVHRPALAQGSSAPASGWEEVLVIDREVAGLTSLVAGVTGAFFAVVSQASTGTPSSAALLLAASTVVVMFIRMLLGVSDQRSVSHHLDALLREQKQLAITDMLTELYNRRFIEEMLRLGASRSKRDGTPLAIMLLDLDSFKNVNDTYGHQSGDVVLAEVAARIRRGARDADIVGRWGGEEFLAVLPGADIGTALTVADRIRREVAAETIRLPDGTRVTVTTSAGVAALPYEIGAVDTVLWQVDQALYAAKEHGRNRVYAWDASGVPISTFG